VVLWPLKVNVVAVPLQIGDVPLMEPAVGVPVQKTGVQV
jgi:hypothetical protein